MFSDNPWSPFFSPTVPVRSEETTKKKKHLEIIIALSSLFSLHQTSCLGPNKPLVSPLSLTLLPTTVEFCRTAVSADVCTSRTTTTAYLFPRATPGISDVTVTVRQVHQLHSLIHSPPSQPGEKGNKSDYLWSTCVIYIFTLFNSVKCTEAKSPLKYKCCIVLHVPQGGTGVHN